MTGNMKIGNLTGYLDEISLVCNIPDLIYSRFIDMTVGKMFKQVPKRKNI